MSKLAALKSEGKPQKAACNLCADHGFLDCDESILSDGRCLIVIAWRRGSPCQCAAGKQFSLDRLRWGKS